MSSTTILIIILCYFGALMGVERLTRGTGENGTFFIADRSSPWFLVAFGMIGASLSGVTFISVPGWVESTQFSYFQMVLGYIVGYFVIATVLLPLYYRLNLSSIYSYLETRFGNATYKTGASFFILSRVVGASFRLYLVANVLQWVIFDAIGIPFWLTVIVTISFIWLYTHRSGIKTIVFTDTLQTFFMLVALGLSFYFIFQEINFEKTSLNWFSSGDLTQIFFFDDPYNGQYFWKQFIAGALIAIVMTGLDQDMMQKNLSCRNLDDAKKNIFWFTIVLVIVNLIFLSLGALLTVYAQQQGLDIHKDQLFPVIATKAGLHPIVAVFFMVGLIAAAYSSADSALTSLTTSICIDLIGIEKKHTPTEQIKLRKQVHIGISILLILVIISFNYLIADESVIAKLFVFAGYTYGPLLGIYTLGIMTRWNLKDKWVPVVAVISPLLGYFISLYLKKKFGFDFGFFILALNGGLSFIGFALLYQPTTTISTVHSPK